MKYSALYHVFPATFHVISWKIGFLWDSAVNSRAFVSAFNKCCQSVLKKPVPQCHFFPTHMTKQQEKQVYAYDNCSCEIL